MARPVRPWFRFYVETFGDRKIRRLSLEERWVWAAILGAARESPEPGKLLIAPGLAMTKKELADYADAPFRLTCKAIDAMQEMGMLSVESDVMAVINWGTRQFESDDVTQRTRDHRERSREQDRNVPKNVPGNTPETETETETETDNTYGVGARKRAHQIPDAWLPNDQHQAFAAANLLDIDAEVAQFRDHHAARGTTMKDWDAAFRTWLRNAVKWRREAPVQPDRRVPNAPVEAPPDGLDDEQLADWYARRRA